MLDRGSTVGSATRLHRKLATGLPITLAAIGSSNVVRGGCEEWQESKCSHPKYTNRSQVDGTKRGWLIQAFEAVNATWPHPKHKLVNRALMATGPDGFNGCLNSFVPDDADAVLVGFADMCRVHTDRTFNSSFGLGLERIVRQLSARNDPPSVVLWNFHSGLRGI